MKVSFVGEEAIDTGGPSREFWRLLVGDIENTYCCGEAAKLVFDRNTPALQVAFHLCYLVCFDMYDIFLQRSEFKMLGSLIAMSIIQGGPGFPLLLPLLYGYISTGHYNLELLTDSNVPDFQVHTLLAEVCMSIMLYIVK